MSIFDDKALKDNKFARNLQLATIGMIITTLVCSRIFTGVFTPETAPVFMITDTTIIFILTWHAIWVWRNF